MGHHAPEDMDGDERGGLDQDELVDEQDRGNNVDDIPESTEFSSTGKFSFTVHNVSIQSLMLLTNENTVINTKKRQHPANVSIDAVNITKQARSDKTQQSRVRVVARNFDTLICAV
jgi:hypothetical protein